MAAPRRSRAVEHRRPRDHHGRGRRDGERGSQHSFVANMVTIDDVRSVALSLPRTEEHLIRGRVKFRVGSIVYVSFSRDESVMGFAFPKEERDWLVGGSPDKFMQPSKSDLRYHWVLVRLSAIDEVEMRELVLDAWRMVVPKRVASDYGEVTGRRT